MATHEDTDATRLLRIAENITNGRDIVCYLSAVEVPGDLSEDPENGRVLIFNHALKLLGKAESEVSQLLDAARKEAGQ